MQGLKIAILAFDSFSDSAGMAMHCQFGPQESLTGFQKLFLHRLPVSSYQCWKAKLEQTHFFKVQSGKITVCIVHYQVGEEIECTTFQIKYKLSSFEKFASLISHFFLSKGMEPISRLRAEISRPKKVQGNRETVFRFKWTIALV